MWCVLAEICVLKMDDKHRLWMVESGLKGRRLKVVNGVHQRGMERDDLGW